MHCRTQILLLCLAFLQLRASAQNTTHPTRENIPDASDPSLVIDLSDLDEWADEPLFPDTTGFKTAVYGREDGEVHELLLYVQDIVHDGRGTLLILDADPRSRRTTNVRTIYMVDRDGQYLGSIGSFGEGPGEFMHPRKLLIAEEGNTLLVLGEERHIEVFRRDDSGSFSYAARINMPTAVSEVCMMRNHIYYLRYGVESGHVIHKYTLTGQKVGSFGDAYKSRREFAVEMLSGRGSIVCNEDQGVVGYVAEFIPALTGFDEDGNVLWRIKVDGIKPLVVVQERRDPEGPWMTYSSAASRTEKGRGRLTPAVANNDEYIYLTVIVSLGNEEFRSLIFSVEAATGAWKHLGRGSIPTVAEPDLQVRSMQTEEVIQVHIRSR